MIDWKQLTVYLALGLGLFLLAYELVERVAATLDLDNMRQGRRTVFGAIALLLSLPLLRLLVRWLDFMPRRPQR